MNNSPNKITGIFVPNAVPFAKTDRNRINEGELRHITNWLIEKGVSGLYPNGSTGESARLSFEERVRVIEIVADENRDRLPILAGAAEANIDLVLEACRKYADLGCRAVSITGPYYFKVSQESIEHYFRTLAEKSPIDIIVYNIPSFANEISIPVLKRLALDCPRIVGTKDSSADMPRFLNCLNEIKPQRPDFSLLLGWEEMIVPALIMGADGGTLASAGVIPEVIMKIYNSFLKGDLETCKKLQFKILPLFRHMLEATNFPEGFRTGYEIRGFEMGPSRQALAPVEVEQMKEIRQVIACTLADCGFSEAAGACRLPDWKSEPSFSGRNLKDEGVRPKLAIDIDSIVKEVVRKMK